MADAHLPPQSNETNNNNSMKRPYPLTTNSVVFEKERKSRVVRPRREGPIMPIPRNERVEQKSSPIMRNSRMRMQQQQHRSSEDSRLEATQSLLSLATGTTTSSYKSPQNENYVTNRTDDDDDTTVTEDEDDDDDCIIVAVRNSSRNQGASLAAAVASSSSSTATSDSNNNSNVSVTLVHHHQDDEEQEAPQSDDTVESDPPAPIHDSATLGLAMEYAAGVGLRNHVLRPTLVAFPDASPPDATRFLGMNSRGEFLLISGRDGTVKRASMERVTSDDSATLNRWWTDDRFLAVADQAWSDWWIHRCHRFDPGCEMYKLVTSNAETLGIVYFERNIVDTHALGNKMGTVSLIRGIRVAPSLNPEVALRKKLVTQGTEHDWSVYHRISALLFSMYYSSPFDTVPTLSE